MSRTADPVPETLRADAKANRDRILEVATAALAADPDASLNAIAKAAGVGAGTLYRHEIDALVALAPRLLAAEASPLAAFRLWCERLVQMGKVKHGIADLLHAARSDEDFEATYWPMLEAVRALMQAAEAAGEIAPGGDAADVLILLGMLWRVPPTEEGEARARRLLALMFRGLGAA